MGGHIEGHCGHGSRISGGGISYGFQSNSSTSGDWYPPISNFYWGQISGLLNLYLTYNVVFPAASDFIKDPSPYDAVPDVYDNG